MTSENFVYWLQGYFELAKNNEGLTSDQVNIIKEHISLVLENRTESDSASAQALLDDIINTSAIEDFSTKQSKIAPGGVNFKSPCGGKKFC